MPMEKGRGKGRDALFLSVSLFCFATWRHDKTTNKQPPQPKKEKFTCSISSCTSLKASRAASWEEKNFCLFIVEWGLFVCLFALYALIFIPCELCVRGPFILVYNRKKKYICSRQTFPFLRNINIRAFDRLPIGEFTSASNGGKLSTADVPFVGGGGTLRLFHGPWDRNGREGGAHLHALTSAATKAFLERQCKCSLNASEDSSIRPSLPP